MPHVPFHDPKRQHLNLAPEIHDQFAKVLSKGQYLLGEETLAFEREFATYCQCDHGISVANGTDALEIALRAFRCGPGDEVITVANAGGYTTTACMAVGATPVYVDVTANLTMSADALPGVLGQRTRAVVVTHLYGQMADVEAIQRQVSGLGIALIEDCAQAHGAKRGERKAGSFGDAACFSFYPTKNLGAAGDAGMVVTRNPDLAATITSLRQYGWDGKYKAEIPHGRNSRMDEIQAAILRLKMPQLDGWNERRRDIVRRYQIAAEGTTMTFVHHLASDFVAHLCVARSPRRDSLRRCLAEMGIDTAVHYPILDCEQKAMRGIPWRAQELPVSKHAVAEVLTLPCFPEMTDEEIDYVCQGIRACEKT